jgi:hypothetical protein
LSRDQEIDRIIDEAAIQRLAKRYIECADTKDPENYIKLFAPNAVLEWRGTKFDTPEKIKSLPAGATKDFQLLRHVITNHIIRLDGDRATGTIYCMAFQLSEVPKSPNKYGTQVAYLTYRDRYVRGGEMGWQFAYREIDVQFLQHVVMETREPPKG